jgi:hypothetical protein
MFEPTVTGYSEGSLELSPKESFSDGRLEGVEL